METDLSHVVCEELIRIWGKKEKLRGKKKGKQHPMRSASKMIFWLDESIDKEIFFLLLFEIRCENGITFEKVETRLERMRYGWHVSEKIYVLSFLFYHAR